MSYEHRLVEGEIGIKSPHLPIVRRFCGQGHRFSVPTIEKLILIAESWRLPEVAYA